MQFAFNGVRKTVRLGKLPRRDAESVLGHVQALLAAHRHGTPVPSTAAAWVAALPDAGHERLSRAGLVAARKGAMLEIGRASCRERVYVTV